MLSGKRINSKTSFLDDVDRLAYRLLGSPLEGTYRNPPVSVPAERVFMLPNKIVDQWVPESKTRVSMGYLQENYNTPLEHTPAIPLANYERNPFIASW